jgi:hypothetical protein
MQSISLSKIKSLIELENKKTNLVMPKGLGAVARFHIDLIGILNSIRVGGCFVWPANISSSPSWNLVPSWWYKLLMAEI